MSALFAMESVCRISHGGTEARRHGEEGNNFASPASDPCSGSVDGFFSSPFSEGSAIAAECRAKSAPSALFSFLRASVPPCLRVKNGSAPFQLSVKHLLLPMMVLLTISGSAQTDDHLFVSPKATYQIFQEAIKDGDSCFWTTKLRFSKGKQECVTLSYGICWPGDFYISPDEKWVLQIQKTGSGDNNGFLYLIEPNHRVWSMSETLCPLAFGFLEHVTKVSKSDLYHTGIAFDAWDIKAGLLRFTLHGAKLSGGRIERKLAYNLKEHTIVEP